SSFSPSGKLQERQSLRYRSRPYDQRIADVYWGTPPPETTGNRSAAADKSASGRLPDVPLVVGGGVGSSAFDGSLYQTVDGNPEFVLADAPLLRAAHFCIVPSSLVTARGGSGSAGNLPDKFIWHGDYAYVVDGNALNIQITIDGRAHTFGVGGK